MNTMRITAALGLMALGLSAPPVYAGETDFSSSKPLMLGAAPSHHGVGTVKQIDKKGRRVELKHDPIKNLGWMGMKMFFDVEDVDMLEEIKVGDKVDFELIKTHDCRFVITDIESLD